MISGAPGKDALRLAGGDRVVGAHLGAGLEQQLDQGDRRGLAHVIGVGLEGQSPQRERAALEAVR